MLNKRGQRALSCLVILSSIVTVVILCIINITNVKENFTTVVSNKFNNSCFDTAIIYAEDYLIFDKYEKLTCIVDDNKKVSKIISSFNDLELKRCSKFDTSKEDFVITLYSDKINYISIHLCKKNIFFSICANGKEKNQYYLITKGNVNTNKIKEVLDPKKN